MRARPATGTVAVVLCCWDRLHAFSIAAAALVATRDVRKSEALSGAVAAASNFSGIVHASDAICFHRVCVAHVLADSRISSAEAIKARSRVVRAVEVSARVVAVSGCAVTLGDVRGTAHHCQTDSDSIV